MLPAQPAEIRIGCAGWSIPREEKTRFPEVGTHLERYAARFSVVEINSSFYRPHRQSTYQRWSASVPANFRFSVKIPKAITHVARLENIDEPLARFLDESSGLGEKLGCLLVQIPPSFAFNRTIARRFFKKLRSATVIPVAFEPRHPTWFGKDVETLLTDFKISRVAADPAPVSAAAEPGGSPNLIYRRLHGSPRIYYSAYSAAYLRKLSGRLATHSAPSWCIFDNTALGAAFPNARQLMRKCRTTIRKMAQVQLLQRSGKLPLSRSTDRPESMNTPSPR